MSLIGGVDLQVIERTLQVAIAPAFILGGVMALLSLLTGRLQRLSERYHEIIDGGAIAPHERRQLVQRARLTYRGITCSIIAACLLCILVIVSFVEPLAGVTVGNHIAGLLVAAMAFLTAALVCFLWEVLLSARSLPLRHDR
jgi:HAMP domain-containing protein